MCCYPGIFPGLQTSVVTPSSCSSTSTRSRGWRLPSQSMGLAEFRPKPSIYWRDWLFSKKHHPSPTLAHRLRSTADMYPVELISTLCRSRQHLVKELDRLGSEGSQLAEVSGVSDSLARR